MSDEAVLNLWGFHPSGASLVREAKEANLKTKADSLAFIEDIEYTESLIEFKHYYSIKSESLPGMTIQETQDAIQKRINQFQSVHEFIADQKRQEDKRRGKFVMLIAIAFVLLILSLIFMPEMIDNVQMLNE